MVRSPLRIIVTGLIAQHPFTGGITWHYLQYVLGLARLGHDVYYLEDSGEWPYRLDGGASGDNWTAEDCSSNVEYLAGTMSRFGLADRWAYRFPTRPQWFGLSDTERQAIVGSADLLVNVSGTLEHPERYRSAHRLVYVDTDPVVTQVKLAQAEPGFRERVDAHDVHFSYGECLRGTWSATGHCWRPTRQPIVLSEWRVARPHRDVFTTVMNWTSYEPLTHEGQTYGQKDVEFLRFLELPARVAPSVLEVALGRTQHLEWRAGYGALPAAARAASGGADWTPHDLLTKFGWQVVDAMAVCAQLDAYREYIASSKAEWSVAKNAYVAGQPGWFSERSACYLAAGKPVVLQDTGFGAVLPIGDGIVPFRAIEEAAAAIREVDGNYARHAKAARAIAEEYFDSGKILTRLIDEIASDGDRRVEHPGSGGLGSSAPRAPTRSR